LRLIYVLQVFGLHVEDTVGWPLTQLGCAPHAYMSRQPEPTT